MFWWPKIISIAWFQKFIFKTLIWLKYFRGGRQIIDVKRRWAFRLKNGVFEILYSILIFVDFCFYWFINLSVYCIAPVKALFPAKKYWYFSMKTCYGSSFEAPQQGASYEYPHHMISWRNTKLFLDTTSYKEPCNCMNFQKKFCFLAHLCQRLTKWAYSMQGSVIRLSVCASRFSNKSIWIDQNFTGTIIGVGIGCIRFWCRSGQNFVPRQPKGPIDI